MFLAKRQFGRCQFDRDTFLTAGPPIEIEALGFDKKRRNRNIVFCGFFYSFCQVNWNKNRIKHNWKWKLLGWQYSVSAIKTTCSHSKYIYYRHKVVPTLIYNNRLWLIQPPKSGCNKRGVVLSGGFCIV